MQNVTERVEELDLLILTSLFEVDSDDSTLTVLSVNLNNRSSRTGHQI
jgi:hypothetical protein